MKKAFWFRLRLLRLRSAYDLVKIRLSESVVEAEEPNQSQSVGTCIVIGLSLPLLLPTPIIWFSLDHKRNVSDGVVSGVGRNENVLILLTPIPSRLWLRLRPTPTPSLVKTSQRAVCRLLLIEVFRLPAHTAAYLLNRLCHTDLVLARKLYIALASRWLSYISWFGTG